MNEEFQTIIDNWIKEQQEKLNQKQNYAMLLIFKKFVEEEMGYKIVIEKTVDGRDAKLCFYDTRKKMDYKYDLDTYEQIKGE